MHRRRCELLLLIILFWGTSTLSAQPGLQQPVTLHLQDSPVEDALLQLSAATGIDITFSPKFFSPSQKVTLSDGPIPLAQALDQCLEDTGISYRYENKRISLFRLQFTLSGYVTDAESGERLVGANLVFPDEGTGTYTNNYGFFSITLPPGNYQARISYLGYRTDSIQLDLTSHQHFTFAITPSLTLEEVVITAPRSQPRSLQRARLPLATLQELPLTLGEPDLLRSLEFLPGVQSSGDGIGGLSIRGGDNGQNLILMDDVPVYHPSHSLGMFSILNPLLVRDVKFYKDGFPARYSGRLSSILDVHYREGNNRTYSGTVALSTLAAQAVLEGPIFQKGGFLLAGRRSHLDPLIRWIGTRQKERDGLTGIRTYAFHDLNVKVWYPFGRNDKVHLSWYSGGDRYFDETIDDITRPDEGGPLAGFDRYTENTLEQKWGNQLISLRWNHQFGNRLFSNLTLIHSRFRYENSSADKTQVYFGGSPVLAVQQVSQFQSAIRKEALRADLDYFANDHHLQFGAHLARINYTPGINIFQEQVRELDSMTNSSLDSRDTVRLQTLEAGVYLEDRLQWGRLELIAGIHLATLRTDSTAFWTLQPRVRLFYELTNDWEVHLSGSRMVQFLHLLSTANAGLPSDLWVPASEKMPPQDGWQTAIGISGLLLSDWRFQVDMYWKSLKDIPQFRNQLLTSDAPLAINAGNWDAITFRTDGKAYGLEVLLQRLSGKWRPWASYTWSRTIRRIESLEIPVPFDHRHRIVAALRWLPDNNWQWSASWQYVKAAPLAPTLPNGTPLTLLELLPTSGITPGSYQLPDYHRLDIRGTYILEKGNLRHEFSLGINNVYNRANGLFFLDPQFVGQNEQVRLQIDGLPILPSLRYQLSF